MSTYHGSMHSTTMNNPFRNLDQFCLSHRVHLKSLWVHIIVSFYFTAGLNLGLWRYIFSRMDFDWGFNAYLVCFTIPLFLFLLFFLILSVITVPYAGKIFLIPILLISSVANYAMFNLGITIDSTMIQNVLETSTRETMELVTIKAVVWVVVTGIIPAYLLGICRIDYQPRKQEIIQRIKFFAGALILIGVTVFVGIKPYYFFRHDNRAISSLANPFNIFRAFNRNMRNHSLAQKDFVRLDPNARRIGHMGNKPSVFILMVGETSRADHWSLNGYAKDTNSDLKKEDVISFKHVYSCATSTSISVPCMFSNKGRKEFNTKEAPHSENLLDLLKQTGYDVLWLENDDGCKGVCKRVPTENLYKSKNALYCDGESCFDEILTDGLEERIRTLKNNTMIVMHTIGSHGPAYFKRYPSTYKKFLPSCDTADLQNCSRDEIVNAYDNTIVYTDHVVASAIKTLKKFPQLESGLMYVSDHGESLGENGIYLHGMPYGIAPDGQKQVPMILWMSERMKKQDHLNFNCIARKAEDETFTHDYLFHTLLALLEVSSKTYDKFLDIFDSCREEPLPQILP